MTFLEELDITKVRRMEAVMDLCPLLESINLTGGYHDVSSTILLAFVKHSWPKVDKYSRSVQCGIQILELNHNLYLTYHTFLIHHLAA